MKFTIDSKKIDIQKLSVCDTLLCFAISLCKKYTLAEHIKRLEDRNMIIPTSHGKYMLSTTAQEYMEDAVAKSESPVDQTTLIALAKEMREIFPKGLKDGSYAWRDNVRSLVRRLERFFALYPEKADLPAEDIIQATREYVSRFNAPTYDGMRILKYFILKNEVKPDEDGHLKAELISDLATCLENLGQTTVSRMDIGEVVV